LVNSPEKLLVAARDYGFNDLKELRENLAFNQLSTNVLREVLKFTEL
jgi:hypothetical protein